MWVRLVLCLVLNVEAAVALDINALWDFQNPELSERRFVAALEQARGEDRLLLQTQLARTHSLRQDQQSARAILADVEAKLSREHGEAVVRFNLEMGRTFASAAHSEESITRADRQRARAHYLEAHAQAKANGFDGLAVDALHMMSFVELELEDQLHWTDKALAYVAASDQPAAKRWQASLLHNSGYALHQLGRYERALARFQEALNLREQADDDWATHVARWMVAWTLRSLDRLDEALALQLRLERERDAVGSPDASVFQELELLYRSLGLSERANDYAEKYRQVSGE